MNRTVPLTPADALDSPRPGSRAWVLRPDNVAAMSAGQVERVMPMTLEMALTRACNLACSECPFRIVRREGGCIGRVPAGRYATPDDGRTTTTPEIVSRVIDRAVEAGARAMVVTGGGEPTLYEPLLDCFEYAAKSGLRCGLYTNGIQIGVVDGLADGLMDPAVHLDFVRVSLNAVTPGVARRVSGASPENLEAQYLGLAKLAKARATVATKFETTGLAPPAIVVSTIIDHRNVTDLEALCRRVAGALAARRPVLDADAHVIRPLTKHGRPQYSPDDHDDLVIRRILDVAGRRGSVRPDVEAAALHLYLGFGLDLVDAGVMGSYGDVVRAEYDRRDRCWANGLFLTVGPDGRAFLCCDRNCDDAWAIGSLLENSVAEIYAGEKRHELLRRVHAERCGPLVCEATCRCPRLNQIAAAIQRRDISDDELERIRQRALEETPFLLS